MPAPRLSVIVITRNESRHIGDCLRSTAFADEWIVVDSGSTDDTRQIAEACGARVVATTDWPGFGAQKNRALALATGDLVFSIDADERVSDELAAGIARVLDAPGDEAAWRNSRLSSFCGQPMRHGDWYPDHVTRLFRRDRARFSDDLVHERLLVDGPVGRLDGELLHDSVPSLDNALDKMNRYTTGRARDKLRQGGKGGLGKALGHGAWAFFRGYLLKRGFLDGRLGLVLALHIAETTYYRYLKMWLPPRPDQK
ncbi:glycosyltransferase family 2 protein [Piscinibacter sakaiensis]|uniref:glycosyltransferase family 2 protein n=1 Tax=Piscinibacter sakaiensis TaxID=1547922 RepID=UPI003AADB59B